MGDIESANLGILRILKMMEDDPEKVSDLLDEFKVYLSGQRAASTKTTEWESMLLLALNEIIRTFHKINQKQNKTIEGLRVELNNALGRIQKLEEKRKFDDPESMR